METLDASAYLALEPEAHRNPQPLFEALRAQETIHRDPTTGFYLVAKPESVRTVFRDSEVYSSVDAFSPALTQATQFLLGILTEEQRKDFLSPVLSIMTADGDTHERLRKAINPYFTKVAMRQRHSLIRDRAAQVLDRLPADCDWVEDFAMPFTVHVIADMLGVPDIDYDMVARWDHLLTSLANNVNAAPDLDAYLNFTKEFTEYFRNRLAYVEKHPDGSLLDSLLQQGDVLTEHERLQLILILFPAASATTVIYLTHLAVRLANESELLSGMRANPDTIPTFVEDSLVALSPATNIFRTTSRDVVLQDTAIPAGSVLLLFVAAANQALPEGASHMVFGHGIHRCLGAQLTAVEMHAALEAIVGRYQRFTLAQPLDTLPHNPHILIPNYPHLPVHLEKLEKRAV
jgi:cytochrome P450